MDKSNSKVSINIDSFYQEELPFISDIIHFNSNLYISRYAQTTGVKNSETVFRGTLFSENRFLFEEYLLNFKKGVADLTMRMGVMPYRQPSVLEAMALKKLKEVKEELIQLPDYKKIKASVGSIMRARRSKRQFMKRHLNLEELASILYYGQGITGYFNVEGASETITMGDYNREISTRLVPSGGALYPIDLYFYSFNIKGLTEGIYKYTPEHHALLKIKELDKNFDINAIGAFEKIDITNMNLFIIYVYKVYMNARKYGDSALAFALLEAGGISQNIHLTATALNIGSCDVGGFMKQKIEKQLAIDGLSQHVIHTTVIGC